MSIMRTTSSHRKREEKGGFDHKMLVVKVRKLTWAKIGAKNDQFLPYFCPILKMREEIVVYSTEE